MMIVIGIYIHWDRNSLEFLTWSVLMNPTLNLFLWGLFWLWEWFF